MYSNIKGYDFLSKKAKRLFDSTYKKHQNGVEDKGDWTAIKIEYEPTYLKVSFKNGKWLAYYPDGSWG